MQSIQSDIIIIGGGLTGLTIAYLLREKKIQVRIIESRDRLGGRILTNRKSEGANIEMGATWLGMKHTQLNALLKELAIGTFQQQLGSKAIYEAISTSPFQLVALPDNPEPSYRIRGGSSTLINELAQLIPSVPIHYNQVVRAIREDSDGLIVESDQNTFKAETVISTLPPYLLKSTINIQPALPAELSKVMAKTHTWMGESIKIGLRYDQPFWRSENSSGTVVSNVGPIPELYDHSNYEDNVYALKGFLNGAYYSLKKEDRLSLVLGQLRKYYGQAIDNFQEYEELVWSKERFTFVPYEEHVLPHQNNGHPIYQRPYLNGRLYIAGSETGNQFPGYMEGAVRSAQFVVKQLEQRL